MVVRVKCKSEWNSIIILLPRRLYCCSGLGPLYWLGSLSSLKLGFVVTSTSSAVAFIPKLFQRVFALITILV